MKTILCALLSLSLLAGCGRPSETSDVTAVSDPSVKSEIRINTISPTKWVFDYTCPAGNGVSVWIENSTNAIYSGGLIMEGDRSCIVEATDVGPVLRVGGVTVGPIPCKAFVFEEKSTPAGSDGSLVIGHCSEGLVGIRITEMPNKISEVTGTSAPEPQD